MFATTSSCSDSVEKKPQICQLTTPQRLCFSSVRWFWIFRAVTHHRWSDLQNSRGKNNPACLLVSRACVAAALCGPACFWAWGAISDTRCQNTHQTLCAGRDVHAGVCTHLYMQHCVCICVLDDTGWRPRLFLCIYCRRWKRVSHVLVAEFSLRSKDAVSVWV